MECSFEDFKSQVVSEFDISSNGEKEHPWELYYDIVYGDDNEFIFDYEEFRLTSVLLFAALLTAYFRKLNVFVLEPTSYYSYQAVQIYRRWKSQLNKSDDIKITICPAPYADLKNADVVFHHGKKFNISDGNFRNVIQIFENENVPEDGRTLSALICSATCE